MLASEKNVGVCHLNSMEFDFVVRPRLELDCQIARSGDEEEKQEDNFDMFVSSLKVKIPSKMESCRVDDNNNGGDVEDGLRTPRTPRTPTSSDHKITASLQCPPAPRKLRSLQLKKRKAMTGHPRIVLDLDVSNAIGSLFPPVDDLVLADLDGKIKKKKVRVQASHHDGVHTG